MHLTCSPADENLSLSRYQTGSLELGKMTVDKLKKCFHFNERNSRIHVMLKTSSFIYGENEISCDAVNDR